MTGTPIVERLRAESYELATDAADEIERLQAAISAAEKRAEEMGKECDALHSAIEIYDDECCKLTRERDEARSSLMRVREALQQILDQTASRFLRGAVASCVSVEEIARSALSPHPERGNEEDSGSRKIRG